MKKLKYIILIIFIGLLFTPIAFAQDSVEIIAIELDSKSDNTTINGEPTYSGLTMNFDISFRAKDDFAKYKVTVKNHTNIDYMISEDTPFNASEYVTYKYSTESELKANSETTFYVTITYSKEVDDSLLVGNKYTEANNFVVQLTDEDGVIAIPDTAKNMNMLLIVFLVILFLGTLIALTINNENYKKIIGVIVLGLLIIPIHAIAAEIIKLTVNVNIEIEKGFKVAYQLDNFHKDVEAELVGYDLSDYECKVIYLETVSNENKYYYCKGIIVDEVRYNGGETATLNTITYKDLRRADYNSLKTLLDDCEVQADGSYLCGTELGQFTQRDDTQSVDWYYSKQTSQENGYPVYNDDVVTMNLSDYDNMWETGGFVSIIASSPHQFTMPNHDVLFSLDYGLR